MTEIILKRVPFEDLEYPGDGLFYFDEKPFTGIGYTLNSDGLEKSMITYVDGLRSGRTVEWYPTKTPMVEAQYFQGVLHGISREWHKNGTLAEDGEYEYGIVVWEKEWDREGTVIRSYTLQESDEQYQLLLRFRAEYVQEE